MITLGYVPSSAELHTPRERQRRVFDENAVVMDLMPGEFEFTIDGLDFAWKGIVPLLDVARQLIFAAERLSSTSSQQNAGILDYHEVLRIRLLEGDFIELYSKYTRGTASCCLHEFREVVLRFGKSVLRDVFQYYPRAKGSNELLSCLPAALSVALQQ